MPASSILQTTQGSYGPLWSFVILFLFTPVVCRSVISTWPSNSFELDGEVFFFSRQPRCLRRRLDILRFRSPGDSRFSNCEIVLTSVRCNTKFNTQLRTFLLTRAGVYISGLHPQNVNFGVHHSEMTTAWQSFILHNIQDFVGTEERLDSPLATSHPVSNIYRVVFERMPSWWFISVSPVRTFDAWSRHFNEHIKTVQLNATVALLRNPSFVLMNRFDVHYYYRYCWPMAPSLNKSRALPGSCEFNSYEAPPTEVNGQLLVSRTRV